MFSWQVRFVIAITDFYSASYADFSQKPSANFNN
jgi:hypothetical protein